MLEKLLLLTTKWEELVYYHVMPRLKNVFDTSTSMFSRTILGVSRGYPETSSQIKSRHYWKSTCNLELLLSPDFPFIIFCSSKIYLFNYWTEITFPGKLKDWEVALIVLACIIFAIIIIALVVWCCRRRKTQRQAEKEMFPMKKADKYKNDVVRPSVCFLVSFLLFFFSF